MEFIFLFPVIDRFDLMALVSTSFRQLIFVIGKVVGDRGSGFFILLSLLLSVLPNSTIERMEFQAVLMIFGHDEATR